MFDGLPEVRKQSRFVSLLASFLVHVGVVLLLSLVTVPRAIRAVRYSATPLFSPPRELKPTVLKQRRAALPAPKPLEFARVPSQPMLAPPAALPRPPAVTPRQRVPLPPAAIDRPLPPAPVMEPPRQTPRPVTTGLFTRAESPPDSPPRKDRALETGSFGAQVLTASLAVPAGNRVVIAGFDEAAQPSAYSGPASGLPSIGGFGDSKAAEGRAAYSGRIASSGSGAFELKQSAPVEPARKKQVSSTQFDPVAVRPTAQRNSGRSEGAQTPIEILYKQRPAYTDEARRLQIEGEVLLEALFSSSGEIRVLRVLHGLGHGLDESAIQAALAIRFRPATEGGRPVDSSARVRIEFALAF